MELGDPIREGEIIPTETPVPEPEPDCEPVPDEELEPAA